MSERLTHGSLFSGIEGFGLGAALAGIKTEWSCEFEDYQSLVIKKNFGEEHEINRDIRTYSKPPFVDIISGGFPSEIGYDAEWQCLSGTDFGIQQNRERLYCIAYPGEINGTRSTQESVFRKPYLSGQFTRVYPGWRTRQSIPSPRFAGKSNGVPDRMDRTECIGNAVQPIIAHYLFECIKIFDKQLE